MARARLASLAGGRLGDVNTTRDGVNVNDGRYENGAWSSVYNSPDMVEEVKVIVAPSRRGKLHAVRPGFDGHPLWNEHSSRQRFGDGSAPSSMPNDCSITSTASAKADNPQSLYGPRRRSDYRNKTFFFGCLPVSAT
jgi:hypothetical protein